MAVMNGKTRSRALFAAALLAALPLLPGCTPAGTATGVGAATGVAAYQERGLEGAARDLGIQATIFDNWLKYDHTLPTKVGAEVYGGRVLLTGMVTDETLRAAAVRLTWSVEGVSEVLNEIEIAEGGLVNFAKDSWITTQLKSRITFDDTIYAINYAIETVNGVVYLLGIAQDSRELDRVLSHARDIKYVRKVISHVRVKGGGGPA